MKIRLYAVKVKIDEEGNDTGEIELRFDTTVSTDKLEWVREKIGEFIDTGEL